MAEESSTSTKRPFFSLTEYVQKNAIQILLLLATGISLWTNINNDVGNINKELRSLTAQVEQMRGQISKLESYQPKIDYLERRLSEVETSLRNGSDMVNAIDNIYAQKVAKLEALNESLQRDIARLERKIN